MVEAGAEAEPRDAGVGEQADELPLLLGVSSGIPVVSRSSPPESHGVGSSSSVMCTQRISRSPAPRLAGRDLEAELGGEALDGEHQCSAPST